MINITYSQNYYKEDLINNTSTFNLENEESIKPKESTKPEEFIKFEESIEHIKYQNYDEYPQILNSSIFWIENNYYDNYFRYKYFPIYDRTIDLASFNFEVYYVRQLAFYWFLSKENYINNKTLIFAKNYLNYSQNFVYSKDLNSKNIISSELNPNSHFSSCHSYIDFGNGTNVNMNSFYLLFLVEMHKKNLTSKQDITNMNCIKNYLINQENSLGGYYFYDMNSSKNFLDFYGSGEALLAMINYYKYVDKDKELLLFLKNSFRKSHDLIYPGYADHNYMSFFTWALQFLREIYLIDEELEWRLYTEIILDEAFKLRNENLCKNDSCIISKSSGEYAYFEGISSVNFMFKNEQKNWWIKKQELNNYLSLASKEISQWQIKSINDYENKTKIKFNGNPKDLVGTFCDSYYCQYSRIDFMQHALSAYIFLYQDGIN